MQQLGGLDAAMIYLESAAMPMHTSVPSGNLTAPVIALAERAVRLIRSNA